MAVFKSLLIVGGLFFSTIVYAGPPQPLSTPIDPVIAYRISSNRVQQDDVELARLQMRINQLEEACKEWKSNETPKPAELPVKSQTNEPVQQN